jgi:hypothetical protein
MRASRARLARSHHGAYTDAKYGKECAMAASSARKGRVPGNGARAATAGPAGLLAGERIEPGTVAAFYSMTRPALAATLGLGRDALTREDRAGARKSQQRLREMLEIVALVRDWAGGEFAAMSWYRATPIPAFGGRTAEALVKDGKAHLVRDYIDHLALGGYA